MRKLAFLVHALSPLHAGTGHAADVVDLPTARSKATGMPFVPGSSIKGVLRDACRAVDGPKTEAVFGPPSANASDHAGALVVGDARLLALPVRSFQGVFAWVTSPLLLTLADRDFEFKLPVPAIEGRRAHVTPGSICVVKSKSCLYLQDLDLPATKSEPAAAWAQRLAPLVSPGEDIFTRRFAIVDDDTMAFFCETATQVDARVRLDPETRTVASGALWLEESLPPETVLVGLLAAERSRKQDVVMEPEEVLAFALPRDREIVQLGGKATTGRGRCRLIPVTREGAEHVRA